MKHKGLDSSKIKGEIKRKLIKMPFLFLALFIKVIYEFR